MRLWVVVIAVVMGVAATTRADTVRPPALGETSPFTVFTAESLSLIRSDVPGRLYASGDALLVDLMIGSRAIRSGGLRDEVIVGGNATGRFVYVPQGNFLYGGSSSVVGVRFSNGSARRGVSGEVSAPTTQLLRDAGLTWQGLAANARTTVMPWGQVSFVGNDRDVNVFTISASALSGARAIQLLVPRTSTVLVNVTGQSAVMQRFRMSASGIDPSRVMFNFADARTLRIDRALVAGSILAPGAAVTISNGELFGQLIARSLDGTDARFGGAGFTGNLPGNLLLVPLPAPVLLTAAGLGAAFAGSRLLERRGRRRRAC
jgi:choice-of-anchor A domain-containing protein